MKYVISLGGSVIFPKNISINYLKNFRKIVINFIKNKNNKLIIICGGGRICREYQKAASKITKLALEDVDWLGIHSTRLNAHLLRTIFRDYAHKRVIKNPNEKIRFKEKILVAAGWKPGCSTDYDAVLLAKNFGVKTIINITNIDYVYGKDPKKYKDAKIIEKISWKEFRKLIPKKWVPGLNVPFDPPASKEAQKLKLKVIVIGKNINNLENVLKGKDFKGTVIC